MSMNLRMASSSLGTRGAIYKNLITDGFGAFGDGSTPDDDGFLAFRTWAIANQGSDQVVLTLPAGYNFKITTFAAQNPFDGIKNLVVSAYGSTLAVSGAASLFLGGYGVVADTSHHANVATVSAGAGAVILVTPSDHSKFSVGQWCLMAGYDRQGFGQPPNPAFFEYVKIASIDTVGGVITFIRPLDYSYKSTWPLFAAGSGFEPYLAGPATLYSLPAGWNTRVDWRGGTVNSTGQTNCSGRDVTLRDVTFTDTHGPIPSQNQICTFENVTGLTSVLEADKIVSRWNIRNSRFRGIIFQSADPRDVVMDNSTISDTINGTPYNFTANNSSIATLQRGATSYGVSNSINLNSSTVGTAAQDVAAQQSNVDSDFSMSGGVMTRALTSGAVNWAVPGGSYNFIKGGSSYPFTIMDIDQSGGNVRIFTSLPGGFPDTGLSVHAVAPTPVIT